VTTLSIVIPAYNEETRLPALLHAVRREAVTAAAAAGMELVEVLVVDDRNRGKGAAFAAGVRRAHGDYVLLADVDLSTPLTELPKLSAATDAGADIAIGSRNVKGAIVERGPLHRKVLGNSFNVIVRRLTGLRLHDTQNGFKLFPTDVAKRLLAEQSYPGFSFDVELLMRADRAGLKIAEVPIIYQHDASSTVRVGSAGAGMLRDVLGMVWRIRVRGA
jgi:dolichyl-phosphate beta-glucosyltransferase